MKNLLLFACFLSVMIAASCTKQNLNETDPTVLSANPALVANFSIDHANGKVNEQNPVLLTNKSLNAVSYLWDLGNGVTSTLKTPAFAYSKCGIYTISLTVTGADGVQQTIKKDITSLCIFGGAHGSN